MLVRMKVHAKIDRCLFIWYLETGSKCPLSDISHTSDKLLSMKPLLYKCERSNVFLTTKRIVFVCGLSPSLLWITPSLSLSLSFSLSLSLSLWHTVALKHTQLVGVRIKLFGELKLDSISEHKRLEKDISFFSGFGRRRRRFRLKKLTSNGPLKIGSKQDYFN